MADTDTAACVTTIFALAELLHEEQSDHVKQVANITAKDSLWLRCFLAASRDDGGAAAAQIHSHARTTKAWQHDFGQPTSETIAAILSAGLVEILPGDDNCHGGIIAIVRDIGVLGRLLESHSIEDIIAAHLAQLKAVLKASPRAAQHGITFVQDLAELSLMLVGRMMDPRSLRVQARTARLLLGEFPVRWNSIVVVDAPASFGMLWKAASNFLPAAFAKAVQFVARPGAADHSTARKCSAGRY